MGSAHTLRLFFALPLPEALKEELAAWQRSARGGGLRAAFPRPEGLHLTVVFLGAVDPARLEGLAKAAEAVARRHGPFELRASGLGGFPERGPARVLWMGLDASEPLRALQADLASSLEPLGFPPEPRPYAPHLTLARPKAGARLEALPALATRAFGVEALVLYESVADPGGRRYEARGQWRLISTAWPPPR